MRFKLTNQRRNTLSAGFIELANLALGALVLGQFLTEKSINIKFLIIGALITILAYFWAIIILPNNE